MGNGHGRLRGANALSDHRSRGERNSNQVRQMESREAEAIIEAELIAEEAPAPKVPVIDRDDQVIANVSGDIGTFVDMLIPNKGDSTVVELFGTVYSISNAGTFDYDLNSGVDCD